jgi:imidazole glycerol phosphate synthase glutamine amidotransferase subunit
MIAPDDGAPEATSDELAEASEALATSTADPGWVGLLQYLHVARGFDFQGYKPSTLAGRVRKLEPAPGRPVPHMGWSRLEVGDEDIGLQTGDYVYFAHSFACDPVPETVASADYGREIPAAVRRGNWLGAQFHPERSGEAGARFLRTWPER